MFSQVYEWMGAQGTRFNFTSSDLAIRLDLIAKVHGISRAEEYVLYIAIISLKKKIKPLVLL